jgi:hypothetical protein
MEIVLEHLPFSGSVTLRRRRLDRDHGDFWPQWEKDRSQAGITGADYFRSQDQADVAHALVNPLHRHFWEHRSRSYERLAAYPGAEVSTAEIRDGRVALEAELPCFSLELIEIESSTPTPNP